MSLNTSSAVVKLNALTAKFNKAAAAANPLHLRLATEVPSTGASEDYGMLGAVPSIREWLGERKFGELRGANWTLLNKEWEGSLLVKKTDISDDRLGLYAPKFAELGVRAANHPVKLLFTLINAAAASNCFDAQYFFDTDHAFGDSGSQSNALTYNASDHTAVTSAELKAAYNAAIKALSSFKDDQGEYINQDVIDASASLVVVTPFELYQATLDGLTTRLSSQGGDNVVINRPLIIPTVRMTSTVAFDVYKVDEPLKPFIWQTREPIRTSIKGLADDEEKYAKFMTTARYNLGYGAWWTAVRTTFN